jgi:HPt (histidine-containing phosphotransfer) domain-containing protein
MEPAPLWNLPDDLADLYQEDPETGASILETFREQIPLSLDRIRERIAAGQAYELGRELHRLKGSLLQLGALATGHFCKEFELATVSEPPSAWQPRFDRLERECQAVLAMVADFLAKPV